MFFCDLSDPVEIAGHTHLMRAQNSPGQLINSCLNEIRIDVECIRFDIDENGCCCTVTDTVCGSDKRMTDSDHFVPGTNARSEQGEMQSRGATRNGACIGGTDGFSEFPFKLSYLGPLSSPR